MSQRATRVFSLDPADDAFIDAQIRSGSYASPSEVVGAGLQALQAQKSTLDDWLIREVAPVYDAMKADPSRAVPADEVFARLRSRHAQRVKDES